LEVGSRESEANRFRSRLPSPVSRLSLRNGEHPVERDPRVPFRRGIDGDAVDDVAGGEVFVTGARPDHLEALLAKLEEALAEARRLLAEALSG